MTPLKLASACSVLLVVIGFALRKRRVAHVPCMLTAFSIDLSILMYLEMNRDATGQMTHAGPVLWAHVVFSSLMMIAYVCFTIVGIRVLRGKAVPRWLLGLGLGFLFLRLANLVTSFFV